jgi:uncharacterized protein YjcR
MTKPDEGGLKRDYCAGQLSLRDMAEIYGISEGAIRKRAKKNNWVRAEKSGTQKGTQVRKSGTQKKEVRTTSKPAASGDDEKYAPRPNDSPPDTKPERRGRVTNHPPFQPGNQHALKHGGYARRLLLSDEVIEDAKALSLDDELFRLRASNLVAAENIGRWLTKLEDIEEPQQRKGLLENISAAEKAMMRNTVRIESITGTIATVGKIYADTDYRLVATEKVGLEADRLKREAGDPNTHGPRGLNDFYADIETDTQPGAASVLDDKGEE